ncbi:MAG TPA: DUF4142 domain-containing protein [Stellaceae bacterium]|jgi:putative membrane protein|nr:DUF4142 domain-containing protein [Stellaceae bacterium]
MKTALQGATAAIAILASTTAFAQTAATRPGPAPAQAPAASTASGGAGRLSGTDQKFIDSAAIGGMFEVNAGKLAEKSASGQVKQFGARMVHDHSAADSKLKQIVSAEGGTVPQALDQDHQQKLDQLAALKGQDFDRTYMQMMVKDHDEDSQDFGKAAQNLDNPQLKRFAAQTLKVIESHDKMAHQITDKTAAK